MAREINVLPIGVKVSIGKYTEGSLLILNKSLLGIKEVNLYINYPFKEEYKFTINLKGINSGDIIDSIVRNYRSVAIQNGCVEKLEDMYIESATLDRKSRDLVIVLGIHG